jgi:hypothetical protein
VLQAFHSVLPLLMSRIFKCFKKCQKIGEFNDKAPYNFIIMTGYLEFTKIFISENKTATEH